MEESLVQVADCTVLGGLLALEDARQKACTHDADALLGCSTPVYRLCSPCAVHRVPHGTRGSLIIGE